MVYKRHLLVLANVTATSSELLDVLSRRAHDGPTKVTLIVPAAATPEARSSAEQTLADALSALREAGVEADGRLGDSDPMVAACEAWDPKVYDEVIVSTLPMRVSKWLAGDLPRRIRRQTDALVTHVVSQPPRPEPHAVTVAPHDSLGVLTPFTPLTWGARPVQRH